MFGDNIMFGENEKNLSKKKDFWVEFFAGRRDGGHRSSAEEFISNIIVCCIGYFVAGT
jgi:hypothetical protein